MKKKVYRERYYSAAEVAYEVEKSKMEEALKKIKEEKPKKKSKKGDK